MKRGAIADRLNGTGWRAGLGLLAVLATLPSHAQPASPPAYMKADPAAAQRVFGPAVAGNIFSSRLDQIRREFVTKSLAAIPASGCAATPDFTVTQVIPLQSKDGTSIWKETFSIACQPAIRRSLLVVADAKGGMKVGEMTPGDTITDPQLQRDLRQGVAAASAMKGDKNCKEPGKVVDTRLLAAKDAPQRWAEVWSVERCGAKMDIEVSFQASPKGGTDWSIKGL